MSGLRNQMTMPTDDFSKKLVARLDAEPEAGFAYCRSWSVSLDDQPNGFADPLLWSPTRNIGGHGTLCRGAGGMPRLLEGLQYCSELKCGCV
jgi:hypothetical protein